MIILKDKIGKAFGKLVEFPSGKIFAQTLQVKAKGIMIPISTRHLTWMVE